MIASHVFTHPFPKALNRVEIGAVARQGYDGEAQPCGFRPDNFGRVTRCTIPGDHSRSGKRPQPGSQMVQELDRVVAVAAAFVLAETLAGNDAPEASGLPQEVQTSISRLLASL